MDYASFFIVLVSILAAVIAALSVNHAFKMHEARLNSSLRGIEAQEDFDRMERMMRKLLKKTPKLMKQFMAEIEESL